MNFFAELKRGHIHRVALWHLSAAGLRKTERFKKFVRDADLVDYWRARGWPDLCHPTTGDDFVCE